MCTIIILLPAIPVMASDAKYFTSTSLSTFSLSSTGLTCDSIQLQCRKNTITY